MCGQQGRPSQALTAEQSAALLEAAQPPRLGAYVVPVPDDGHLRRASDHDLSWGAGCSVVVEVADDEACR